MTKIKTNMTLRRRLNSLAGVAATLGGRLVIEPDSEGGEDIWRCAIEHDGTSIVSYGESPSAALITLHGRFAAGVRSLFEEMGRGR